MKKYLFLSITSLLLASFMVACEDDDTPSKSDFDIEYDASIAPTISTTDVVVLNFSTVKITGSLEVKTDKVLEIGAMLSTDEQFTNSIICAAADLNTPFTVNASNLNENTTYYVRTYAVTANSGIVTSESKTIKTPVAPVYSIDGTYTAIQYDAQGKEEPESYKVQINYVAGSETSVEIFNIFNGGQKITGTYNKADGTLVIPTDQIVMLHPSYGEVLMKGVDDAIENYTKTISCSFTAKGGTLITGNWQASCSAGSFGFFYLSMKHE